MSWISGRVARWGHTAALLVALALPACRQVAPFSVAYVDRSIRCATKLPLAYNPANVGTFAGPAKSGAGYFYDEVLEYRVWLHPERGARHLAGNADYFAAFACYENALDYRRRTSGAEDPLALVRQREWIDEPTPDNFIWVRGERITEWQPSWLDGSQRESNSISDFLAKHGAR